MALVTPKKSSFFDPPAQPAERPTQAPPAPTQRGGFFNQGPASRSGQSLTPPRTPVLPRKEPPAEAIVTEEVKPGDNLWIYAQAQHTPEFARKSFNNGNFSGTDINPMWRIKMLTLIFGPCGIGWITKDVKYTLYPVAATGEVVISCELALLYRNPQTKEWSEPVYGVGGNQLILNRKRGPQANDEGFKMAYTDAVSVAVKALGFSADIYFENDRTKYTLATEITEEKANAAAAKVPAKPEPKAEPKPDPKTAAPAAPAAPQPEGKTPEASPTVTDVRQPSPNEVKARAQAKVMKILAGYKGSSPILPTEAEELTIALSEELGATINGGPDDGMNAMMEAVEELTKSGELPPDFGFGSVPVSELANYISTIRIYVQTRSSSAKKAAEDFFAVKKEAPNA